MLSAKVFSLLAIHGEPLFEANVDRLHELTAAFANLLRNDSRFELATEPQTNIVCFRLKSSRTSAEADSQLNERVRDRLLRQGKHYIVKTVLHGETWLRCTIANPFTSEVHLVELLDAIVELGATIAPRTCDDEPE